MSTLIVPAVQPFQLRIDGGEDPVGLEAKKSDECLTPRWLAEVCEQALEEIDLDACSHPQSIVPAKRRVLLPEDGLLVPREGLRVFTNCPFSSPLPWAKLFGRAGAKAEVFLIRIDTTTTWWSLLWSAAKIVGEVELRAVWRWSRAHKHPRGSRLRGQAGSESQAGPAKLEAVSHRAGERSMTETMNRGEEIQDLRNPARIGRIIFVGGHFVRVAWSTGRTTKIRKRLIGPSSRFYHAVGPQPRRMVRTAQRALAVPTSAAAARGSTGEWHCHACPNTSFRLVQPWRVLFWTRGAWAGKAAIVCSDECHLRLREFANANP